MSKATKRYKTAGQVGTRLECSQQKMPRIPEPVCRYYEWSECTFSRGWQVYPCLKKWQSDMLPIIVGLFGFALLFLALLDGFETIVQPRRVSRQLRAAFIIEDISSRLWYGAASHIKSNGRRESFLSIYGPLSLFLLMGTWALGLITGFALLLWAFGSPLIMQTGKVNLAHVFYFSGTAFTTLGFGDITPFGWAGRILSVLESGLGLSFLALVISYLPVLYQSFSQRETRVSMLDEWAGSPPVAVELLKRLAKNEDLESLDDFLKEWETWSAELLESHLSYPVLGYFRSQHQNQSWVTSLTMILDLCTLVLRGIDDIRAPSARRTFAIARHALVDLSQVYSVDVSAVQIERLPAGEAAKIATELGEVGLSLTQGEEAERKMATRRAMYEPYAIALSERLLMPLAAWLPAKDEHDNWRMTPRGPDEAI